MGEFKVFIGKCSEKNPFTLSLNANSSPYEKTVKNKKRPLRSISFRSQELTFN